MIPRITLGAIVTVVTMALSGAALAEFPDRPITFIVPSGPGGGSDTIARTVVPYYEKYIGGKIAVVNIPGAASAIGLRAALKAKPDGYTMTQGGMPSIAVSKINNPNVGYNVDSFDYIGSHARDNFVIAVLKKSKFKTLSELIAYGKANPNKFTCSHPGLGGSNHLAALLFMQRTGAKLTLVPFRGGGRTRKAMLGGHVMGACMGSVGALKAKKKIRVLAQSSEKRFFTMTNVPTMKEAGVDLVAYTSRVLIMRKGVPADILKKHRDALRKAVSDPGFIKDAKKRKVPYAYIPADEYYKQAKADEKMWNAIWKKNPWQTKKKKK